MAQRTFSSSTAPLLTDLDLNLQELYDLREQITTAGYTGAVEKLRIAPNGELLLGQLTLGFSNSNSITLQSPSGYCVVNHASGSSSGTRHAYFGYGGVEIGSISQNGTTGVSYNTASDYRLKTAVTDIAAESGTFIDSLRPVTWMWISDGKPGAGFLAHELQSVSPSSVTGTKDAVQAVGVIAAAGGAVVAVAVPQPLVAVEGQTWVETGTSPVYQSVEYGSSEMIAMLVAEVQSLRRRVKALEPAAH